MTTNLNLTSFAPEGGEASYWFEWLSTEEITEALGGEPDDHGETVPRPSMQPAFPTWPRVYPGL
jgi:hypothetical protein